MAFLEALTKLGQTYEVAKDVEETIEKFICAIYGKSKLTDVNLARAAIFWDRYNKQKKIIDLCMLPPCKENLKFHIRRSNYIAYIMRHAHMLKPQLQHFSLHGWNGTTAEAEWMTTLAPQDIADVLIASEEANVKVDDGFDELYDPEDEDMQYVGECDDDDVELEDFS